MTITSGNTPMTCIPIEQILDTCSAPFFKNYITDVGEHTSDNVVNDNGQCWKVTDCVTGNETGSFWLVSGQKRNTVLLKMFVRGLDAEAHYLFSIWASNTHSHDLPQLTLRVSSASDTVLFEQSLGAPHPVESDNPVWRQIGASFATIGNRDIIIELVSEAGQGSVLVLDSPQLRELIVPRFVPLISVDKPTAIVGEIVTYTITIENDCDNKITDVQLRYIVQDGMVLVANSLLVNDEPRADADMLDGFFLGSIKGGTTVTVSFQAVVSHVPAVKPTPNTVTIKYSYSPIFGARGIEYCEISNTAFVEIIAK